MIALAAASAVSSSTFIEVLTPLATVAAAILAAAIGFGAAGLKHKWDTEADEKRWRNERTARDRAQLLDAFAEYLVARPDVAAADAITRKTATPAAVASAVQLAATRLLILLPAADQRAIVDADLKQMVERVASWAAPSAESRKGVPSREPILDLARELVVERDESDQG